MRGLRVSELVERRVDAALQRPSRSSRSRRGGCSRWSARASTVGGYSFASELLSEISGASGRFMPTT